MENKTLSLFIVLAGFLWFRVTPVLAASPIGFIDAVTQDSANTITVSGWAQDPDNLNLPIRVHIYINGTSGTGLGALTADMASSDVGNHRYGQTFTVPPAYIDGERHIIYAYGIDNNGDATSVLTPQSGFPFQMTLSCADTLIDLTDLNLTNIQSITVKTTYDNDNAIGLPAPNYEYSGHIIKQSTEPYYQYIYGARCNLDVNKKCQIPINGSYSQASIGDGDHIKYAKSNDGIHWDAQELVPIIYQGQEEGNPFLPELQNRMDPTIIKWGDLYYMYYQLQIDNNGCTDATCDSLSDSITYATSTDLKTWTKSNRLIINNKPKAEPVVHPKAIKVGNEIWLYFAWVNPTGSYGMYLVKSTDPTNFDFSQKIANSGNAGNTDGSQHLILFPNDPANALHIVIGYRHGTSNYRIPTLIFSHDGINWTMKPGSFPAALDNLYNLFCNIGTDVNNSLTPNNARGNSYSTVYSCSTMDGSSRGNLPGNVWDSNLSSGGFEFTINYKTAATPTTKPTTKPGDLTGDGHVDIYDYNELVSGFGTKYTIYDYNTLVANYGK